MKAAWQRLRERAQRVGEREWVKLPQETVRQFSEDEAPLRAAALAFFSLFAVAPLFVLVLVLAGLLLGAETAVRASLFGGAAMLLGAEEAKALETVVSNARLQEHGPVAGLLGLVALLFGASRVFAHLETSLNRIWDLVPHERRDLVQTVRKRLASFAMVLGVGFILVVSLVATSLLAALVRYVNDVLPMPPPLLAAAQAIVSVVVLTVVFGTMYKYLPDARIRWRDVGIGAFGTALLFTGGLLGIGQYLGRSALASAYGSAGAIVVVLLWFYYAALIFLLGAEFTQVWAQRHGAGIRPEGNLARRAGQKRDLPRAGKRGRASG